jgi:limonene-1,2-epoxide hydrolase
MPEMDALATLHVFGEYLGRGDAEAAAALFAPDAVYEEPPHFRFTGRPALHAFIADFAARHSNVSFTIKRSLMSDDGTLLAAEWRWSYTRDADGARKTFAGMSFVELRVGLITSWRGYSALMGEE